MSDRHPNDLLMMQIAEEYMTRRRCGEVVDVESYCLQHPDLAEEIRATLRTYQLVEDLGPNSSEPTDDRLGPTAPLEEIGGYRIIGEVGRGGMGVVYDAVQQSLGRRVALKVLPSRSRSDGQAASRFLREARAAASMHHTNIVPVFEVGEEDDQYFFAMQLIEGQGLDAVIEELRVSDLHLPAMFGLDITASGASRDAASSSSSTVSDPISSGDSSRGGASRRFFRSVARIGVQVASALEYAHRRGVIHRDIKPSNLLLDKEGTVWVSDFGLAKTEDEGLTQTGDILGTLRYMAPERLKGQCDVRSDVYSLGLTLYELVGLVPAFPMNDRLELLDAIRRSEPLRIRSVCPRIPRDLETIILKASDSDPATRYRTADSLAEDLRRFLAGQPIRARRQSLVEQMVRWVDRNRRLAASLAAIVFLMMVITVGSMLLSIRIGGMRDEAVEFRYFSQMNLAGTLASEPLGFMQLPDLLAPWRPDQSSEDLRGWEWFYLRGKMGGDSKRLQTHSGEVWSVAWSPDDTMVASACLDGQVLVWDVDKGESMPPLPHPDSSWCVCWSPDGTKLATACDDGIIRLWEAETWQLLGQLKGHQDPISTVDWHPNGMLLASAANDGTVRIWDVAMRRQIGTPLLHPGNAVRGARWSPDGEKLAAVPHPDPRVWVWDVTGRKVATTIGERFGINDVCWDRLGERLVTADITGSLTVWDATSGAEIHTWDEHGGETLRIDRSPDGNWLGSSSRDGTVRVWDMSSLTPVSVFAGSSRPTLCVEWDRASGRLISGDAAGTVRLHDVAMQKPAAIEVDESPVIRVRWASDSSVLSAVSQQKDFIRCDSNADDPVRRFDVAKALGIDGLEVLDVSPDGKYVLGRSFSELRVLSDVGEPVLSCQGVVRSHCWTADGTVFAASVRDEFIDIWDTRRWEPLEPLPIPDGVSGQLGVLAWSPDGRWIAGIDDEEYVWAWEVEARSIVMRAEARGFPRLAWGKEGALAMTGGSSPGIRIWNPSSDEPIRIIEANRFDIHDLCWSPDGSRIAIASSDGTVRILDSRTGHATLTLKADRPARTLAWSPDGMKIAAGTENGQIHTWDASSGYAQADDDF